MKIRLQLIADEPGVRARLKHGGWRLEPVGGSLIARHAAVATAQEARTRLAALGLLTSAALRIEFLPEPPRVRHAR